MTTGVVVQFSGGPWDGEQRTISTPVPPEIRVPMISTSAPFVSAEVNPAEPVDLEVFTYQRRGVDWQTGLVVFTPKEFATEIRFSGPPSVRHRYCRACDVRWYGTAACWCCGETGDGNQVM